MTMLGKFLCVPQSIGNFYDLLLTKSEGRRYRSNSLGISGISLKFDGMIHRNMKHIAI